MKKWEYYVLGANFYLSEEALDKLGKEGWELVAVTIDGAHNAYGYLKREI